MAARRGTNGSSAIDVVRPPNVAEVASIDQDDLFGLWTTLFYIPTAKLESGARGIIINPDPVAENESNGLGVSIYDDMLDRDNHLAGLVDTRFNALMASPCEISAASGSPEDERIADFVREVFENIDDLEANERALVKGAVMKGYSIGEVVYELRPDSRWGISAILDRDQKRFVFDTKWFPRLLTTGAPFAGVALPDRKMIVTRHGAQGGNAYGIGIGRPLFWANYFSKNALKFWLIFAEKYGMPTAWAKTPKNFSEAQKAVVLAAIKSLQRETGIRTDEDVAIELLEATRSGSGGTYKDLAEYFDNAKSKRVLGQTLTTEPGGGGHGGGSYALGKVQNTVRQDILDADARLRESIRNQATRWIVDINFGGGRPASAYPKWTVDAAPPEDLYQMAQRDQILVNMGVPMGQKSTLRRYGLPDLEPDDTPLDSTLPTQTLGPDGKPVAPGASNAGPGASNDQQKGAGGQEPPNQRQNGGSVKGNTSKLAEGKPPLPTERPDEQRDAIEAVGAAALATEFLTLQRVFMQGIQGKAPRAR